MCAKEYEPCNSPISEKPDIWYACIIKLKTLYIRYIYVVVKNGYVSEMDVHIMVVI